VTCPYCAAPVHPPFRIFCSTTCCRKYTEERRTARRSYAVATRRLVLTVCLWCAAGFMPTSVKGRQPRHCSDRCRKLTSLSMLAKRVVIVNQVQCDNHVATTVACMNCRPSGDESTGPATAAGCGPEVRAATTVTEPCGSVAEALAAATRLTG
jgi:hypothetical protein